MDHRRGLIFALLAVFALSGCASAPKKTAAVACPDNLGSAIRNFCVVTPEVLWRGGKPGNEGAEWLIRHGVRTIVNLELVHDDKSSLGHAAVEEAQPYPVAYFRIRDWEPLRILAPSTVDDHVAHFLAIVRQQSKPIFVHCRYGENRTGVMVAAYRILVEGMNEEKAIEEMNRYHGLWSKADEKYIRGLTPERRENIRRKILEWMPKLRMDAQVICSNGTCAVSAHRPDVHP